MVDTFEEVKLKGENLSNYFIIYKNDKLIAQMLNLTSSKVLVFIIKVLV